ncbi:hypothetical protein KP509_1Z150500 [Ceratopteris richardii]|nr:hypothetical protein KP509_1Z150500 [Ceratopteris richardii]
MRQRGSSPPTHALEHLRHYSPFRSRLHCHNYTPISRDAHCRQSLDRPIIHKVDRSPKCIAGVKRKVSWLRACAMAYQFLCSSHDEEQRAQPASAYQFGETTRPSEKIMNVRSFSACTWSSTSSWIHQRKCCTAELLADASIEKLGQHTGASPSS